MRNSLKITAGVVVAIFFLWLALRNIEFSEVLFYMQGITYWWLIPYTVVSLFSHYLRSERWRLLVKREQHEHQRDTLFAAVLVGYLVNYAVPRLGEISRSVYVAQKSDMSTSDVIGTVVLERVIDFACMVVMIIGVVVFILADMQTVERVFGTGTLNFLAWLGEWQQIGMILFLLLAGSMLLYLSYMLLNRWRKRSSLGRKIASRVQESVGKFFYGLTAIFRMKNWPAFILTTIMIWVSYAAMSYIPFFAFDLPSEYGLGFHHAWVVMIISAVGVAIPSPGGVGTYHWFVTQTLVVLYSVPAAVALAYAFVTHAVMMLLIIVVTPLMVLVNNGGKLQLDIFNKSPKTPGD